MKVLCLLLAVASCASARVYYPEEDNVNYKRFHRLITKSGNEETIDLLDDEVTIRASESDLTYYLYNRANIETPHRFRKDGSRFLATTHFDAAKKTYVIIHGWVDDYTADVNTLVRRSLLNKVDVNIIVVDWSPIASGSYGTAQGSVTALGQFVADFINTMIDTYGISGDQITLIGHSLGAHIAGNAGSKIKSPVGHIIGLDPAAPQFSVTNTENRLDPSDAQYVQVIHTNGRFLGFSTSIGHADFYPNGGMVQAGCGIDLLGGCSHARAFQYLSDAINGAKYTATLCGSYLDFQNSRCSNNRKIFLGTIDVDKSAVGDFFLNTNSAEPFAQG